jgi:hypothetical protein
MVPKDTRQTKHSSEKKTMYGIICIEKEGRPERLMRFATAL